MGEKRLFYNGRVLDPEKGAVCGGALLAEDGIIRAVGKEEELWDAPGAEKVNLEGAFVMPAFLDAHSHFTQTACSFLQASLRGVSTEKELVCRIRAYIKESGAAPGAWVTAGDYDHNLMEGGKNPPLSLLDQAAPENPLFIRHQSGHSGLMNSLALKTLGITESTEAPEGGRIEKKEGKLTGRLEENALFHYQKKLPMPDGEALEKAYKKAQDCYAAHGITMVQEGMLTKEMFPMYRLLLERRLLRLDLAAYLSPEDYPAAKEEFAPYMGRYRDHLKIAGLKIFLDGSPQSRTAWLRKPYIRGGCGYGVMTDEAVRAAMELSCREGLQLLAHCNGDQAIARFLSCMERTVKKFPEFPRLRPVIIHGQIMGRDQVRKAAALGAFVSFFGAHVFHWGDVHIKNLGFSRAAGISPAASALEAGLPFTFHQDTPVIPPDMWETVWCAVCRKTRAGTVLGEQERIPVREALLAVTKQAAAQYGEADKKGSLAPGKNADFILIDRDPFRTAPEELKNIQVLKTFCRGRALQRV